jgi:hypothetical protein
MTRQSPRIVVARVSPCEQFRYRVDLPESLDPPTRDAIRRQVHEETTRTFLECTRRFQAIGWEGCANPAFVDSRHSPSDSRSQLLHTLLSLKTIELGHRHFRKTHPPGPASPTLVLEIGTRLRWSARRETESLCAALGLGIIYLKDGHGKVPPLARMGGAFRANWHADNLFARGPINRLETTQSAVTHRIASFPVLRGLVGGALRLAALPFLPAAILRRARFTRRYRAAALRILGKLDGPENVCLYFDLRMGRNQDVAAYLKWKFGPHPPGSGSPIVFTHFVRRGYGYSRAGMTWAEQALERMEKNPAEGAIVVNFLIPPLELARLWFRRHTCRRRIAAGLRDLRAESSDFITRLTYSDFLTTLGQTRAFPLEIAAGYQHLFGAVSPGVVIQADSIAKSARHFTACARSLGHQVIYLADRICTEQRTSNQLITDAGANPHLPDRFVTFDQVTAAELVRQGVAADRIHRYDRMPPASPGELPPATARDQVVIYLQAYDDNLGAMLRLGAEIARAFPHLRIAYQEHPSFPVCGRAKAELPAAWPGRLRFLAPGETIAAVETLAMITGYSTAVVPGILRGIPLIWLRGLVDNSIYGETFLRAVGFAAADEVGEVMENLARLINPGDAVKARLAAGHQAADAIFRSGPEHSPQDLAETLRQAGHACFSEIRACAPR